MLRFQGKLLVLLFVGLMLANVQCFSDCLVAPCGSKPMPCHKSGQSKAEHCSHGHDLTAPSHHVDETVAFAPVSFVATLDERPVMIDAGRLTPVPVISPTPPAQLRI